MNVVGWTKRVGLRRPKPRPTCEGFVWIGQSFAFCDRCGEPYWAHTHDEFRGVLTPITRAQAAASKAAWGGPMILKRRLVDRSLSLRIEDESAATDLVKACDIPVDVMEAAVDLLDHGFFVSTVKRGRYVIKVHRRRDADDNLIVAMEWNR